VRFSRSARSAFQLACSSFKLCFFFRFPRWLQGRAGAARAEQRPAPRSIDRGVSGNEAPCTQCLRHGDPLTPGDLSAHAVHTATPAQPARSPAKAFADLKCHEGRVGEVLSVRPRRSTPACRAVSFPPSVFLDTDRRDIGKSQ
jgi:hypothetical protein